MVALHAAVHDGIVALLPDTFLGDLGVDPVRVSPHVRANLAKLDLARRVVADGIAKVLVEVAIVEEDIGVVVPVVEVALDRLERLDDAVELRVAGEHDEGGIGARLAGVGLGAARNEHLVVLFTDPPAERAR